MFDKTQHTWIGLFWIRMIYMADPMQISFSLNIPVYFFHEGSRKRTYPMFLITKWMQVEMLIIYVIVALWISFCLSVDMAMNLKMEDALLTCVISNSSYLFFMLEIVWFTSIPFRLYRYQMIAKCIFIVIKLLLKICNWWR